MNQGFWIGKKVLITGHTGFKGSWLSKILRELGARVYGYALEPDLENSLYKLLDLKNQVHEKIGDVRDYETLYDYFQEVQPDIVFHLAAQPLVRESYKEPRKTYETNVMGSVHILECTRQVESVKSFLNITTDKVYENKEWCWGYREVDRLNGFDPYSNSKSCSDLLTDSYRKSFFNQRNIGISTVRAGNVIGGGDFAKDRILPDCIRAAQKKENIIVRNPYSIRPYQHVLEALGAYLLVAQLQYENKNYEGAYNIGPDEKSCIPTKALVECFCRIWGQNMKWVSQCDETAVHEAGLLKLDCSKAKQVLGWQPVLKIEEAVEWTVKMAKAYYDKKALERIMTQQIQDFLQKTDETGA